MKLKAGIPLITKNPQALSNAVVYRVEEGTVRSVVWVISDYGNIMKYSSIEEVLEHYSICRGYLEDVYLSDTLQLPDFLLENRYDIRDRLQHQIELLTEALEGLE